MQITTGVYRMRNGLKAYIDSIKPNGQAVGSFHRIGFKKRQYWVWEPDGKAKFVELSSRDLVEKIS